MTTRCLSSKLPVIACNPTLVFDIPYFEACADAGALPLFDTEFFSESEAINHIRQLSESSFRFGIRTAITSTAVIDHLQQNPVPNLDLVVVSYRTPDELAKTSVNTHFGCTWFLETVDIRIDTHIEQLNPDGLLLKGNEAGGKVSCYTSFILMQWYLENSDLPLFIHGGAGMHTTAGMFAAGASGIVLDSQLFLSEESPVSEEYRTLLEGMTETDTALIGETAGVCYRFFSKLGTRIIKTLKETESSVAGKPDAADRLHDGIVSSITGMNTPESNPQQSLFYLGQDATFAKHFRRLSGNGTATVSAMIRSLFHTVSTMIKAIDTHDPLVPDSPLAREHGTLYPVIQGPMANISDNPEFAKTIYENGGLPFFAMGNLPADLSESLITEGNQKVKRFGAGLIGIETFNKTLPFHLDLVKKSNVPFALFAGGIPSQVNDLEAAGTKTYLHTPTLMMLDNAIENGCSRYIFEGTEAGGHVGSLTSFVLWEAAVTNLMMRGTESLNGKTLVFAGGISTRHASFFISGLTSLMAQHGARIGIQAGSAYLYTREIIELGAIGRLYQKTITESHKTIVTGNTVGLPSRTVPTPFARRLVENEHRRIREGVPLGKRKTAFEEENLGSLLIGAKGFLPDIKKTNNGEPVQYDEAGQYENGNFLVGDSLAFLKTGITISELHDMYFKEKRELADHLNRLEVLSSPSGQVNDDVAIIGAGCILPNAETPEAFWETIQSGTCSIRTVPDSRLNSSFYYSNDRKAEDKTYTVLGGHVDTFVFDHDAFGYTPEQAGSLSRSQQMLLHASLQAVKNAGIHDDDNGFNHRDAGKTAVIIASCLGNELSNDLNLKYYYPEIRHHLEQIDAFTSLPEDKQLTVLDTLKKAVSGDRPGIDPPEGSALNMEATGISRYFGCNGASYVVDAACATSFTALDCAIRELLSCRHDTVITGGINTNLSPEAYIGFGKMGALSASGSWPFDERADGFILGEGTAVFVLKRLRDAVRENCTILGIIRGVGSSSDGRGKAIAAPNPAGQALALNRCYDSIKTGISASDIDYIEAHGTSTIMGDQAEIETLKGVYTSDTPIGISSVKSQIGHLLGGAGAAGLLKALLAINNKTLPPNGQFKTLSSNFTLDDSSLYIIESPEPWKTPEGVTRKAAVSSYGFGGINYHVVVEEYSPEASLLPRNVFSDPAFDYNDRRIVIAGMGAVLPGVQSAEDISTALSSPQIKTTLIPESAFHSDSYTNESDPVFHLPEIKASVIESFQFNNIKYRIPPKAAASLDRSQLFALEAAGQAIEASGLSGLLETGNRTAVIIGTPSGKRHVETIFRVRTPLLESVINTIQEIDADVLDTIASGLTQRIRNSYPETTEDTVPGFLSNIVAGRIANFYGCNGANFITDASCASSAVAMGIAAQGLTAGDFEFVITGGVDTSIYPLMMNVYNAMGFFPDNAPPCTMGEGAVLFVMTTLETARKHTMPVLTEITDVEMITDTGTLYPPIEQHHLSSPFGWLRAAGPAAELAVSITSGNTDRNTPEAGISALGGVHGTIRTKRPPLSEAEKEIDLPDHSLPESDSETVVALLSGQGAQRPGMMKELFESDALIRDIMERGEALFLKDRGYSLLDIMFGDDDRLNLTENTQPAVFLSTAAIYSRLNHQGFSPDRFIGHSVGEFTALYCSGILEFDDAFRLILKRSSLMKEAADETPGAIIVVFDGSDTVSTLIQECGTEVYIANKNSSRQTAVSGKTEHIESFITYLKTTNTMFTRLPLSGAFHTPLFRNAAGKLGSYLSPLNFDCTNSTSVISNVTGDSYPSSPDTIKELLIRQITSPVEFIASIRNVFSPGKTRFIEIGPGKLLTNLLKNILDNDFSEVAAVNPKQGERDSFQHFLKTLTADGLITKRPDKKAGSVNPPKEIHMPVNMTASDDFSTFVRENEQELKQVLYSEYIRHKRKNAIEAFERFDFSTDKIVISGVSVGLPGTGKRVFDPENFSSLLKGTNFIEPLPLEYKEHMVDKHVTRLHKHSDGNAKFVEIESTDDVIQLAGQLGYFDLDAEYGIKQQYDTTIGLAMAAGIEALKDAHIPLVMQYKTTSTGSRIPDGYALPEEMQAGTGVILSALWPYSETILKEMTRYFYNKFYVKPYEELENIYYHLMETVTDSTVKDQVTGWFFKIKERRKQYGDYKLKRDFAHNITPLGSAHFAQYIRAKGPNIQMSGACASTTQAIGIAEDWIRTGRCERVIVIGGETPTSEAQSQWIGSGFLSLGAASIKKEVKDAAKPFDEMRNGTILGSGAVSLILEKEGPVKRRGMNGQAEVLGTHIGNTAFHTYNIDVKGIASEMDRFVSSVETRHNLTKTDYSKHLVFMSHETFTPARGGSADAEITALKTAYPETYSDIHISNTKGYTGHTLGAALEDAVLVKVLQTGMAPPIANLQTVSDNFKDLKLGRNNDTGDFRYGIHLAAGFGSHLAFAFFKKIEENTPENNPVYTAWLKAVTGSSAPATKLINNTLCAVADGPLLPADKQFPELVVDTPPETVPVYKVPASPEPLPNKIPDAAPVDSPPAPSLTETVRQIIADQTGYDTDMLEDGLDLEADLGIDTVKQVEVFGKISDHYGLNVPENLKLKDLNTISRLVEYLRDKVSVPETAPATNGQAEVTEPPCVTEPQADTLTGRIRQIISEQTGYDTDMLEENLDLEADLGIDTVKQVEIFGTISDYYGLKVPENLKLRDLNTISKLAGYLKDKVTVPDIPVTPAPAEPVEISSRSAEPVVPRPESLITRIKQIIADQTGYDTEMLDDTLDLEADLGIDTVKQVEIFGNISEHYGLKVPENLKLRDLNTISKLEEYLKDKVVIPEHPETPAPVSAQPEPVESEAESLTETIKHIIAEQTGYETEMLDDSLDLEADLGIDTVKQVEIFGTISSSYNLKVPENLKLKDLNTIRKLADYMQTRVAPDVPAGRIAEPVAEAPVPGHMKTPVSQSGIKRFTVHAIEKPLSENRIDRFRDKTLLVTLDSHGYADELARQILASGGDVIVMGNQAPATVRADLNDPVESASAVKRLIDQGKTIDGLIHLAPLDDYFRPSGFFSRFSGKASRSTDVQVAMKSLFAITKVLYPLLDRPGTLVSAISFNSVVLPYLTGWNTPIHPAFAGIAGMLKTINKELENTTVRIVDFKNTHRETTISAIIGHYLRELSSDDLGVETGYIDDCRYVPVMRETPCTTGSAIVKPNDTILVTGGALGITYEILKRTASLYKTNFLILGRSRIYDIDPAYLLPGTGEKEIMASVKQTMPGEKPLVIKKAVETIMKTRDAVKNIRTLQELGVRVTYEAVDVADADAVSAVIKKHKRISGVIHAAGIEESQFIVKKEQDSFDRVTDVKVAGIRNLLHAMKNRDYRFFITFSSVTARFGNEGQVDYTGANDMTGKILMNEALKHPHRHYKVYSWTAWKGAGMAENSTVKSVLESRGITFLPLDEGIDFFLADLQNTTDTEVVITGTDSAADRDGILEVAETKGISDISDAFPFLDRHVSTNGHAVFERTLTLDRDLFLYDHSMDDTPIFLGATGIETMAQAAAAHSGNGNILTELSDFSIPYGIKILKGRPKDLTITAEPLNGGSEYRCAIHSVFRNPAGKIMGDPKLHYQSRIVLSDTPPEPETITLPEFSPVSFTGDAEDLIYHPKRLFMDDLFRTLTDVVSFDGDLLITRFTDICTGEFFKGVVCPNFQSDVVAVDAMFQTGGLLEFFTTDSLVLPYKLKKMTFYKRIVKGETYLIVTRKTGDDTETNTYQLDLVDDSGSLFIRAEDFQMVKLSKLDKEHSIKERVRS